MEQLIKAVNSAEKVLVLAVGPVVLKEITDDIRKTKEDIVLLALDVRESERVDFSELEELSEDMEHFMDLFHRRAEIYIEEQKLTKKVSYDTVIVAQSAVNGRYIYSIYNDDPELNQGLITNIFLTE